MEPDGMGLWQKMFHNPTWFSGSMHGSLPGRISHEMGMWILNTCSCSCFQFDQAGGTCQAWSIGFPQASIS